MRDLHQEEIIRDLRQRVKESFASSADALLNLLDALCIGPRIATPFEAVLSPVFGYHWSSIYASLERAASTGSINELRQARREWLKHWQEDLEQDQARVCGWRVYVLDATSYERPKTETVRLGYVHSCEGMRVGHGLSLLSRACGRRKLAVALRDCGHGS